MRVLGCVCGYADCSHVAVRLDVGDDTVIWSDSWATCRPGGEFGPRVYPELGPIEFSKDQYLDALSKPSRKSAPLRETRDSDALASGIPPEPAHWLCEMTMAFGRDFVTPDEPEATTSVLLDGLRALREGAHPSARRCSGRGQPVDAFRSTPSNDMSSTFGSFRFDRRAALSGVQPGVR